MKMKRLLFIVLCLISFELAAGNAAESIVWICTSSGAYAYHNNRQCQGLNNCKATIIQVTKEEAIQKWGRRPCKRCYGPSTHIIQNQTHAPYSETARSANEEQTNPAAFPNCYSSIFAPNSYNMVIE